MKVNCLTRPRAGHQRLPSPLAAVALRRKSAQKGGDPPQRPRARCPGRRACRRESNACAHEPERPGGAVFGLSHSTPRRRAHRRDRQQQGRPEDGWRGARARGGAQGARAVRSMCMYSPPRRSPGGPHARKHARRHARTQTRTRSSRALLPSFLPAADVISLIFSPSSTVRLASSSSSHSISSAIPRVPAASKPS